MSEDKLREAILYRVRGWFGNDAAEGFTDDLLAAVVLTDRERYARQRAAEELRAAAEAIEAADWPSARGLRYRADALTEGLL